MELKTKFLELKRKYDELHAQCSVVQAQERQARASQWASMSEAERGRVKAELQALCEAPAAAPLPGIHSRVAAGEVAWELRNGSAPDSEREGNGAHNYKACFLCSR